MASHAVVVREPEAAVVPVAPQNDFKRGLVTTLALSALIGVANCFAAPSVYENEISPQFIVTVFVSTAMLLSPVRLTKGSLYELVTQIFIGLHIQNSIIAGRGITSLLSRVYAVSHRSAAMTLISQFSSIHIASIVSKLPALCATRVTPKWLIRGVEQLILVQTYLLLSVIHMAYSRCTSCEFIPPCIQTDGPHVVEL